MNKRPTTGSLNIKCRPNIAGRALAIGIAAGSCIVLGATELRTNMSVRATVLPVATLQLQSETPAIEVSAQDLARGYVDISKPTALRVYSNSPAGYALEVEPLSTLFSSVAVHGLGPDISLGAEGGTIVQRWQRAQSISLALTYRFFLAPGLQPGTYSWPLRLRVSALASDQ